MTSPAPAPPSASLPEDMSSVSARGLTKTFDDTEAVTDLSFEVSAGTVLGLIGPSGCGKTTTVRMLNGAVAPTSGEVRVLGTPPAELSRDQRQRLGYLPQQPVLFSGLTAWENLQFHAGLNGVRFRRSDRLHQLLDFVDLADDDGRRADEMSGGMKRRLALAAALVHDPEVIFLDEPTAGIDPILRARLWDRFHELADEGRTLVVTTQYIGEAAHCDQVGLLAEGRLLELDKPEELRRKAAGGDLLIVETDRPLGTADLSALGDVEGVLAPAERFGDDAIRLVVEPELELAATGVERHLDQLGVAVLSSRSSVLDYDDMFVRLVEHHQSAAHEQAGAEAVGQ